MSDATETRIAMGKALSALDLEVHESISKDVSQKVRAAIVEVEQKLNQSQKDIQILAKALIKAADGILEYTGFGLPDEDSTKYRELANKYKDL